jgi:hypothetical protein
MRVLHWYPNFLAGGGVANFVLAFCNAQAAAGVDVWIASLSRVAFSGRSCSLADRERLVARLLERFEVDEVRAEADVDAYLGELRKLDLLKALT